MRLLVAACFGLSSLWGQMCAPIGRLQPTGSLAGTLDGTSCRLSDGTPYAAYRLDLPARGQIRIDAGLPLMLRDEAGVKIAEGPSISRAIEAGTYTVVVNGTGGYSIQTAFHIEPGMMCANFPSIGLNQSVAGTLGATGCAAPDGTLYEAYALTTLGAGTLTVTIASSDFTTQVTLRGSDGQAIQTGGSKVAIPVDADSQYEIAVASMDTVGAYQMTTSFELADTETCRAQKTLSDPASDSASIAADSCTISLPGSGDLVYYNYYALTVGTAGVADVSVTSREFNATLALLDESGNALATDAGGAGGGNSDLRMQLAPGNYRLRVVSSVPSGGAYTLDYKFVAGAPQPCAPGTLNLGDAPAGALSAASCRTALGLADLYTLSLPTAGTLDLAMNSGDFNTRLAIRDAKDNVILTNEDVDGITGAHITADLPAGTYLVAAAATEGAGAYRLTAGVASHDVPACTSAQPLAVNGGYIQRLGPASCHGANGEPVDMYEFVLPSDATVALVMTSSQVDGHLELFDQSGKLLRSDDNSYLAGDPLIIQYLAAGTYRVAARAASSSTGGLYRVDLLVVPGERPPFCAPKGTLELGGTASGTLGITGCQYPDATLQH